MATVDTTNGGVVSDAGNKYPYTLLRERKWNVGRKKHLNELTGVIEIYLGNKKVLATSWGPIKAAVEAHEAQK